VRVRIAPNRGFVLQSFRLLKKIIEKFVQVNTCIIMEARRDVQAIRDNTGGFRTVLDGLKAWPEFGIEFNLVGDKFPNTQQK